MDFGDGLLEMDSVWRKFGAETIYECYATWSGWLAYWADLKWKNVVQEGCAESIGLGDVLT